MPNLSAIINLIAEQVVNDVNNATLDNASATRKEAISTYNAAFNRIPDKEVQSDLDEAVGFMLGEEESYYCHLGVEAGFKAALAMSGKTSTDAQDAKNAALCLVCQADTDWIPFLSVPEDTPRGNLTAKQIALENLLSEAAMDEETRLNIKDAVLAVYLQTALYWCEKGIRHCNDKAITGNK